jgi:fructokinase
VDLGGTKTEIVALDRAGDVARRVRVPTPARDYEATLRMIAGLVDEVERSLGIAGKRMATIGVGTPGSASPVTGLLRNANSVSLNGRPFRQDLEALLGRPVRVENDANCFALSEAADGAGRGAKIVFGVILGTGTGGGLVIEGQVLRGANAIGSEWGHNPLPWMQPDEYPGATCYCGRPGCIETFLSGPGLAAGHARAGGRALSAKEIVAAASQGDAKCEATLARYEGQLARALASVINLVDPDVIVLGGGMSNADRLYAAVPGLWDKFIFSDVVRTRLVRNMHGDSSGVRGAAWLWSTEEARGA